MKRKCLLLLPFALLLSVCNFGQKTVSYDPFMIGDNLNVVTTNELGTTPFTTRTEQNILKKNGFSEIRIEPGVTLQIGDILWTDGHTEVYIGANMTVGAHQASNGGSSDGQYGDQDGSEIAVVNMAQGNYWQYIYRYER